MGIYNILGIVLYVGLVVNGIKFFLGNFYDSGVNRFGFFLDSYIVVFFDLRGSFYF